VTTDRAYSSTVVSRWLLTGSAGGAIAIAALAAVAGSGVVLSVLAGVAVLLGGCYAATVRLAVGPRRIVLGQGPFGWPSRKFPTALITGAYATSLTAAQVFGFGTPWWQRRTTKMTVKAGPALVLELSTGETIRVSTPDPESAIAVLRPVSDGVCPHSQITQTGPVDEHEGRSDGK
jgi:hypothetical protein